MLDFNLGSTLTDVANVEKSIEMKAFLLLFNSARNTNEQLSRYYGQEKINNTYSLVSVNKHLEREYKDFLEQKITIRKNFFDDIINSGSNYLINSFKLFKKFCEQLTIQLPKNIRTEYYISFRENLKIEFQNNKEQYQELEDFFKNPILEQNEILYYLFDYFNSYKEYYTKPLQQESATQERLKDLYIDPFFSIHKNNLSDNFKGNKDFYSYSEELTIHQFFNDYFLINKKLDCLKENYDMVFVLGQPGQGKTSFCYKLLYDYLENYSDLPPVPILFVKIRDLVAKDFISDPFRIVAEHYRFINFSKDELVLVLDGLDESYMSGGITNEDLRNLYERLKKRSNKKIKIILTSRFNFLSINDACLDNTLILHLNELTDNQIKEYCKKFKKFYPLNSLVKSISSILGTKKYEHIKELLRQAVLIYFIAISDIEIEEKDSKSRIYDKIFDSLAQRSWDSNGQLDYINPKLKLNPSLYKLYLREYIRNIAFEIYHSPQLYITVNKLLELDATKLFVKRCFTDDLNDAENKIKEFSKYLLISFYFQQTNKNNEDAALEFFHNSLWEFLTAEYMWEENKNLVLRKDNYDEFKTVKKEEYFEFLDKLSGQKKIGGFAIKNNLIEIIFNEEDELKKRIFDQSIEIFYELLENDFLLRFQLEKGGLTSAEKAAEHFGIFWCFLHECNINNKVFLYEKGCHYLFQKNELNAGRLENTFIMDSSLSNIFIFENTLKNVKFFNGAFIFEFADNELENIIFSNSYINRSFFEENNIFKIKFINCEFSYYVNFTNNTFKELIMNNVEIIHEVWFDDFIENNTFDDIFLQKHFVEKRLEKNHNGEDIIQFFIMCRDFKDNSDI